MISFVCVVFKVFLVLRMMACCVTEVFFGGRKILSSFRAIFEMQPNLAYDGW